MKKVPTGTNRYGPGGIRPTERRGEKIIRYIEIIRRNISMDTRSLNPYTGSLNDLLINHIYHLPPNKPSN